MNYFDKAAATWDENPANLERTKAIGEAIIQAVPLSGTEEVLEYGCGTGLLSFLLQPRVKSLVLADESEEMLRVLREKVDRHRMANMHPLRLNLLNEPYGGTHDLICTQMALHHILDTEKIIAVFYNILRQKGYLCIADLVEEDGSFHAHHDHYVGHNGFNTDRLAALLAKAGFTDIAVSICCTIERRATEHNDRKYPVFLMIGKKG
jgi:ubiquinone/menaquinone biosynthesis C-methylase UbiE